MDKPMNRIKEVLVERGIKQTWLAEKLGKSIGNYKTHGEMLNIELSKS